MFSRLTRICSLAIFLVVGLFATHASAQNVLGGRNIFVRDQAVRVTTGFPDIEIAYHMPWDRKIELVPRIRFGFATDLTDNTKYLMGGMDLRYQLKTPRKLARVARSGKGLNVSMILSAPLVLTMTDDPKVGFGLLWPGIAVTYRVNYNLDFNTGVQLQDTYFPSRGWNVLLELWGGLEYNLNRKIRLLGQLEFGPNMPPEGKTNFYLRVMTGVAYKL